MNHRTAILSRILGRETYSLLQYMSNATLWTGGDAEALARVHQMGAAEKQAHGTISKRLEELRFVPLGGYYPEHFSEYHYLGLDFLLPRLAADQQRLIDALEADLAELSDPEDRDVVVSLLQLKRRHLEALQQLSAEQGQKAGSTRK